MTEVETVQSLTLTASTGSVVTTGPAGVNRADTITYAPAGYNHVYGALAFQAAGNQLDANIAVGAGTLHHPLLIVSNYTGAFPTVRLGGVILVQDTDYYPSLRAASNELWITLNRDLTGALNHLQISTTPITSSPFALAVDSAGNGVLEEAEAVEVSPTWTNETAAAAGLTGTIALSGIPGPAYTVVDGAASYGPIPSGGHASCAADCYTLQVTGTRPVQHWDALLTETLNDGSAHGWTLHVGTSFSDVSSANTFYRFIETIYHYGVSTGCGGTSYCPSGIVLRGQMAAFIARALAGSDAAVPVSGSAHGFNYNCTSGGASAFDDVAPVDAFCRHIHYIYARNVTVGISPTTFSPGGMTSRAEMAHFIARALVQPAGDAGVPASYTDPTTGLSYDCTDSDQASNHFSDVGDAAFGCKQVHYLWARGVVSGFPDGTYRSSESIPRDAMAKFLANGFGLKLYKP